MNVILDTCSIINLSNTDIWTQVLDLDMTWHVGPIVRAECTGLPALEQAMASGRIKLLDDSGISAATFLSALNQHHLGEGETECLCFAAQSSYIVCTDDRKARHIVVQQLGYERIIGSIGLLKMCVAAGFFDAGRAVQLVECMRAHGGFLPRMKEADFLDVQ